MVAEWTATQADAEMSEHLELLNGSRRRVAETKEKSELLVDKYAPQRYVDLLSDERTNREVLGWLKSWDRCVFGLDRPDLGKVPILNS